MIYNIAILLNAKNYYYFALGVSLLKGFNLIGVSCCIVDASASSDVIRHQIDDLKPNVVFEINRTRGQSRGVIPYEVIHISWIQDAWYDNYTTGKHLHFNDDDFGGSDLIYFMANPKYFGLSEKIKYLFSWGVLYPGVDSDFFYLNNSRSVEGVASLCGFIPDPISFDCYNVPVLHFNDKSILGTHFIEKLKSNYRVSVSKHTVSDIHRFITEIACDSFNGSFSVEDIINAFSNNPFLLLMDTELPRVPDRCALVDAALKCKLNVSLYGPTNWLKWAEYSPYYRGHLKWSSDLASVYRSSQFNLHNGAVGMHSRVLECMGAGGSVFVNYSVHDKDFGFFDYFSPGEDFIAYETNAIYDTLSEWKYKGKVLEEIARNGASKIQEKHLWRHRAEQIISDLEQLRHVLTTSSTSFLQSQ